MNKRKIFNDPVYGFVNITSDLIFDIIEHPLFQRLRRIQQLGLTHLIYPGAHHTRFHHALGAMHLMTKALHTLRSKNVEITEEEFEATLIAILLHDIGHGPFSHALEYSLLPNTQHESLSFLIMKQLNEEFNNQLDLTLKIFQDSYHKRFLHELVSSQLDMDRLDYLRRDSFYTGVSEGSIGIDRIISMLNVNNGQIVVEQKALYSIENFLNARRLMYWQVYLHKTSVCAEKMLINLILRAKHLMQAGEKVYTTPNLKPFLTRNYELEHFQNNVDLLLTFGKLDDYDIWACIKQWVENKDFILSELARRILERDLFKIKLSNSPLSKSELEQLRTQIADKFGVLRADARFLMAFGEVTNKAYILEGQKINIMNKNGEVKDIAQAADLPNIAAMSKIVKKHYLCFPKTLSL